MSFSKVEAYRREARQASSTKHVYRNGRKSQSDGLQQKAGMNENTRRDIIQIRYAASEHDGPPGRSRRGGGGGPTRRSCDAQFRVGVLNDDDDGDNTVNVSASCNVVHAICTSFTIQEHLVVSVSTLLKPSTPRW